MIKMLILDVDGTLTDGGIYLDATANELKKFSVKDGVGIHLAKLVGIDCMILTGRESTVVQRRAEELGIKSVFQNVKNKSKFLSAYLEKNMLNKEMIAYCGDDLNDLKAMEQSGFVCCPQNACEEVKNISHFISDHYGGDGAVRDCIEYILKKENKWEKAKQILIG